MFNPYWVTLVKSQNQYSSGSLISGLASTMAVVFPSLSTEECLKQLDQYLLLRTYITGHQATQDDITAFGALSKVPGSSFPKVSCWYNHISALLASRFPGKSAGVKIEGGAAAPAPVKVTEAPKEDEDDNGLDMQKLEETVRSVQMPGLFWGASKLVVVGYGIKKLQIMMTIEVITETKSTHRKHIHNMNTAMTSNDAHAEKEEIEHEYNDENQGCPRIKKKICCTAGERGFWLINLVRRSYQGPLETYLSHPQNSNQYFFVRLR